MSSCAAIPGRFCAFVCLVLVLVVASGTVDAEQRYATISVDELHGYARSGWPVHVGVAIAADAPRDGLWLGRVRDGEALDPVAFQVLGAIEPVGPWQGELQSIDLVFLTDLDAHESAEFRLYYGEGAQDRPAATLEHALDIEHGEHFAVAVDTGEVRFDFHPTSGQLFSYEVAGTDRLVDFRGDDPIHYNPDVRVRPPGERRSYLAVRQWDVTDPSVAPSYDEHAGPIAWRLQRRGAMPGTDTIEASVTYTAFAGMPWLIQSSSLRFTDNTSIAALMRNNELVFGRGLHTHGVHIDHDMQTTTFRVHDPDDPENRFEEVRGNVLPPDTPFVGLFHEDGCGIGAVTLDYAVHNPEQMHATGREGAHYYVNAAFPYLTRAELFNYVWGGRWNDAAYTIVPAGSVFAERSAFLTFTVDSEASETRQLDDVKRWTDLLRHPPRVRVTRDGRR